MGIYRLIPGGEPERRVDLLIESTKITSPKVINAVKLVLVKGVRIGTASTLAGVHRKSIRRALDQLEKQNAIFEQLKELDWQGKVKT